MFGPYRAPPEPDLPRPRPRPHEEVALAWALVVIGGARVVLAIASREVWGAESTLATLFAISGIAMLARR